MALVELDKVGQLTGAPVAGLAGITDLLIYETDGGPVLLTVTRGGGWLISYDLGRAPGEAAMAQSWQIGPGLAQLESTNLDILGGDIPVLLMAGLNSSHLLGLQLGNPEPQNMFENLLSLPIAGAAAQSFSEMAAFAGTELGLVAIRGGGLKAFDATGNTVLISELGHSQLLRDAEVSDIAAASIGGRQFALASFWDENAVSLFELGSDGSVHSAAELIAAPDSAWFSKPSAVALAGVAGQAYAIVAGAGSHSLTILEIGQSGGLSVTDHVLDTRDTRFAGVSVFSVVEVNGLDIIVAAGADDGVTAFALLPGGRLHLLAVFAGSAELPLRGVTGIALQAEGALVRIFVSTESAPYLSELELALTDPGKVHAIGDTGGTVFGTPGNDVLAGGVGNDRIEGGAGDDVLLDGAGSDTMSGGDGADDFLLSADGETDVITGFQPGLDRIDLTALGEKWDYSAIVMIQHDWGVALHYGGDVLKVLGTAGTVLTSTVLTEQSFITFEHLTYPGEGTSQISDIIEGTSGDDVIRGSKAAEKLSGLAGDDRILALEGDDTIWGEDGKDALFAGPGNDSVTGGKGADIINGGSGNDTIRGDAGNDALYGWQNNDQIHGGTEADRLFGGSGDDSLFAGQGNDTAFGGDGDDRLDGAEGNDVLFGSPGMDTIFGSTGRDKLVGGQGDDLMFGNQDNDTLLGNEGNDTMNGGLGNDILFGGEGHDKITGLTGNDTLLGGGGHDVAAGGQGHDTLYGGYGNDRLTGGLGDDMALGHAGNDTLFGGAGNDRLFGGEAMDVLLGGDGSDKLYGGHGSDVLFGGHGNDVLTAHVGADSLFGNLGDDRLFGGTEDDLLHGGYGNDFLAGGAGFDSLAGGVGDDEIYGGPNGDTFVFANNHGNDTIRDFDVANGHEAIDLSGISGLENLAGVFAASSQSGSNVLIRTSDSSSILIADAVLSDLGADDFVF